MADSPSVFEQLLEYAWRGISFPVAEMEVDLEQDHAEHRWPDRDGAHVEATGRAPLVFHARALFRNGIAPGKAEKWGVLYPTTFRQFIVAAADRTSGPLQHPEFGTITCKLRSAKMRWEANKRDGCDVDCTWVETFDPTSDLASILAAPSPIASVLLFATDLDAQLTQITPPITQPAFEPSFADAIRGIQAISDQASLLAKQTTGSVAHIQYRVQSLSDSIAALRDNTLWPAQQSCQHLLASLNDIAKVIATPGGKRISQYLTPAPTTMAALAATLRQSISDLILLNPVLPSLPTVQANVIVRYYG